MVGYSVYPVLFTKFLVSDIYNLHALLSARSGTFYTSRRVSLLNRSTPRGECLTCTKPELYTQKCTNIIYKTVTIYTHLVLLSRRVQTRNWMNLFRRDSQLH